MNIDLQPSTNMYHSYDFDTPQNIGSMNNRLFCTFTTLDVVDNLLLSITSNYDILYNKIFILGIKDTDEYVVTYNVDQGNISQIPYNTILVHRKKDTNTLYTINALNSLIKSLNGGVVDTSFPIDWQHYRNSILLTQLSEFKQLNTKIHKIINLD